MPLNCNKLNIAVGNPLSKRFHKEGSPKSKKLINLATDTLRYVNINQFEISLGLLIREPFANSSLSQ